MKKINITSAVLLVYLIVMSVIGWPGSKPDGNFVEYFCIMGVTLVVIILLRLVQIKRFKIREKARNEKNL